MILTLGLLLSLAVPQLMADLEVTPLQLNAEKFKTAFNESPDRFRLVAVFSPT